MGWLAKLFPGPAILTKIAVYGLVFALGGAVGNGWATQRALQRELQASADRQRENHLMLFAAQKEMQAKLRAEAAQQREADKAAYAVLEKGKAEAEQAAQQARASLRVALNESQKLKETTDGLKNVADILAAEARRPVDPGCVLPGRMRLALDYASGASDTAPAGDTETTAPGVSDGSASAATPLTCTELANGYVELGRHDRLMRAWILSFQAWADTALR